MQPFQLALTPSQAAYLQNYLPVRHSLQVATLQTKRPRAVKKIDQSFTSEFTLLPLKKIPVSARPNQQSSSQKVIQISQMVDQKLEMNKQNQRKINHKQSLKHKDSGKQKSDVDLNSFIQKLLRVLKNCKYSWPFRNPVDPVNQEVPHYLEIIKEPMDLKTVQKKFKAGEYHTFDDFDADIKKIISNSYKFNDPDTNYYSITIQFETFYLDTVKLNMKKSEMKPKTPKKSKGDDSNIDQQLVLGQSPQKISKAKSKQNKIQHRNGGGEGVGSQQKTKLQVTESSLPFIPQKSPIKQLNFRERQKIFNKIDKLSQQNLQTFIKLCGIKTSDEWSEMEIELAQLSEETFRKIDLFLQEH